MARSSARAARRHARPAARVGAALHSRKLLPSRSLQLCAAWTAGESLASSRTSLGWSKLYRWPQLGHCMPAGAIELAPMDAAEVARFRAETPGLTAPGKLSGAFLNSAGAALMPQVVVRVAGALRCLESYMYL